MTTGIYFHEILAEESWPIIGNRYSNFSKILKDLEDELENSILLSPQKASEDLLLKTHSKKYFKQIKTASYFNGATLTIGACIEASLKVWNMELTNAVVFLAAAGHHAHPDSGWGGTYLSCIGPVLNVLRASGLSRLAYIDTDSHHGDGAREILQDDHDALHICFCSSNRSDEKANICVDVGRRTDDEGYLEKVENELPLIERFDPEIVIHFFGHDTHRDDYGDRGLSTDFFPKLARRMRDFAEDVCNGRYVVIDGGGANSKVGKIIWPEIIRELAR